MSYFLTAQALLIHFSVTITTKNDDNCRKGREGGGQRVMIEIVISENPPPLGCALALAKGNL